MQRLVGRTPAAATDAATKGYVDTGLSGKAAVGALPSARTSRQSADQVFSSTPTAFTDLANASVTFPALAAVTNVLFSMNILFTSGHGMRFQIFAYKNGVVLSPRLWPVNSTNQSFLAGAAGDAYLATVSTGTTYEWKICNVPLALPVGATGVGVQWSSVDNTTSLTVTDCSCSALFGLF